MKKLSLFFVVFAAFSQTVTVSAPTTVIAGQTIAASVSLAGGASLTGLQLIVPAGSSIGTQITVPNKTQLCSSRTCLWYGLTSDGMPDITFLKFTFPVPVTATPGSVVNLTVSPTIAADLQGSAVPISVTSANVTVIQDPLDLNSDGKVDMADTVVAFANWTASPTEANAMVIWSLTYRIRNP